MNKLYFGIPLVLVIAFALFFQFSFVPGDDARKAEAIAERKAEQEAEAKRQYEERLAGVQEAVRKSEERKRLREEEAQREEAQRVEREEAESRNHKALADVEQLNRDIENITKQLDAEKDLLAKARETIAGREEEKAHLIAYTKLAKANAGRLHALVEQIEKVEKAKADAALLAAKKPSR